jgi:hypothetical protein
MTLKPRVLLSLVSIIFALPKAAQAADLYNLITQDCESHPGLILNVSENKVQLLTQAGELEELSKSQVKAILIYKASQRPVHNVKMSERLRAMLKDVYLNDQAHSMITGWPIGFIENLVIFFDTDGKTHLIDLNQILKFRSSDWSKKTDLLTNKSVDNPVIGDLPIACNLSIENKKGILASQILVDLIKVEELFSSLENGFQQIQGFEERTYFYAKPYLFDRKARMGFINIEPVDQGFQNFPLYFQSSSGEPYRFQNFWKMGGGFFPESPSVSNPFSYYTEAKSHLFHGVFLGNLGSLSAGSPYYSTLSDMLITKLNEKVIISSSYNYMALMGIDFESWSFSFGTYYPIFLINVKKEFREVLASNVSPIFRLRYMNQKTEASLVYSKTDIQKNSGVNDYDILFNSDTSVINQIDSFSMQAQLIKANFSFQFGKTLKLSESLISLDGHYSEVFSGVNQSVSFQHLTSQTEAALSFGEYITVRAYMLSFFAQRNIDLKDYKDSNQNYDKIAYGSALEFVF